MIVNAAGSQIVNSTRKERTGGKNVELAPNLEFINEINYRPLVVHTFNHYETMLALVVIGISVRLPNITETKPIKKTNETAWVRPTTDTYDQQIIK